MLDQNGNMKYVTASDPAHDDDRKRMKGFLKSPYSQSSHWSFNFNLQYPTSALPIAKRDNSECIRSSIPSSTISSAALSTAMSSSVANSVQETAGTISANQGDGIPPHMATVPDGVVNFIKAGVGTLANSNSANQLNNDKSANQFNNAIQRISNPKDSMIPSRISIASSQIQVNPLAASSQDSA